METVTNLDLINGSDGSLDFNGGHQFEGFLNGGRAHLFVAESDGGAQGLKKREKICKLKLFLPNLRQNRFGSRLKWSSPKSLRSGQKLLCTTSFCFSSAKIVLSSKMNFGPIEGRAMK